MSKDVALNLYYNEFGKYLLSDAVMDSVVDEGVCVDTGLFGPRLKGGRSLVSTSLSISSPLLGYKSGSSEKPVYNNLSVSHAIYADKGRAIFYAAPSNYFRRTKDKKGTPDFKMPETAPFTRRVAVDFDRFAKETDLPRKDMEQWLEHAGVSVIHADHQRGIYADWLSMELDYPHVAVLSFPKSYHNLLLNLATCTAKGFVGISGGDGFEALNAKALSLSMPVIAALSADVKQEIAGWSSNPSACLSDDALSALSAFPRDSSSREFLKFLIKHKEI